MSNPQSNPGSNPESSPIEIKPEQFAALSADERTTPVVMLNLVKYRAHVGDGDAGGVDGDHDGDGRDAYLRYSRGFIPLLKQCGGTILWAGDVTGVAIGDDAADAWDYAVLVQYPDRAAFVRVMQSPEYAAINPHRLKGLAKHIILPVSETYSKFAG